MEIANDGNDRRDRDIITWGRKFAITVAKFGKVNEVSFAEARDYGIADAPWPQLSRALKDSLISSHTLGTVAHKAVFKKKGTGMVQRAL